MKLFNKYILIILLLILTVPVLSFAQNIGPRTESGNFYGSNSNCVTGLPCTDIRGPSDIKNWITTAVGWLSGLFFTIAVLFMFYAAFLYLTAADDEEKLSKGKSQLIYSIIALGIALLAGTARLIIENVLNL